MKSPFKISIGALMAWISLIALQLVFFQGVWQVLVIPPMTIAALAVNLGLFFLLVRPSALKTRIIGLLLGAIMAALVTILPLNRNTVELADDLQITVVNWISSQPDQEMLAVRFLQFVATYKIWIAFALLDLIGFAIIWAGGWVENRLRSGRNDRGSPLPSGLPPLDDRAASPL